MKFIETIEEKLGKKAEEKFLPMQDGDILMTYADISGLEKEINFQLSAKLAEVLEKFGIVQGV